MNRLFELGQYTGDVAHAPVLTEEASFHGEDIARGEAQREPRGRNAEVAAGLCAGVGEAGDDAATCGHCSLDLHPQVGHRSQATGEQIHRRLLGAEATRRRCCGAHLVVDVARSKQRGEGRQVVGRQGVLR